MAAVLWIPFIEKNQARFGALVLALSLQTSTFPVCNHQAIKALETEFSSSSDSFVFFFFKLTGSDTKKYYVWKPVSPLELSAFHAE